MSARPPLRVALVASLVSVLPACAGSQAPPSSTQPPRTASPRPTFAAPPAGPFPTSLVEGLRTEPDVPFTEVVECGELECTVPLDVLAPTQRETLPTIVLVPGGPVEFHWRRYLEVLAAELARHGAVVFLTTYRSSATGNEEIETLHDVRCSVRYARSVTGDYGGDAERVVLVGHSIGSVLVMQTAVTRETDTPGCAADGDAVPDAIVGLSEFDPTLSIEAPSGPPMLLAGGSEDPLSAGGAATAKRLRAAGFDAEYREFAETGHEDLVDPEATPGVIDLVFEAVDWTSGTK